MTLAKLSRTLRRNGICLFPCGESSLMCVMGGTHVSLSHSDYLGSMSIMDMEQKTGSWICHHLVMDMEAGNTHITAILCVL